MSRLISFAVLIAIIVIIGLLFYKVLIGFFIPVFLAAVLVVVFRPLHRWVLERTGERERLAAVLTTLLMMLTLLLPVAAVGTAAAVQGLRLLDQNDPKTIALRLSQFRSSLGLEMPSYDAELRTVGEEIDKIVDDAGDSVVSEADPKLLAVGKRTKQTLLDLKQAVEAEAGDSYTLALDELIDMTDRVGTPNDEEFGATKLAVDLKTKFNSLRTALLGGSMLAFARETANPTKVKIADWVNYSVTYLRPRLSPN